MKANVTGQFYRAAGLSVALLLTGIAPIQAQSHTTSGVTLISTREAGMEARATGTFEVKVAPLPEDTGVDTGGFGRLSIDKQFSGGITGPSRGQMVAAGTAVEGSAAYVALERVTGTLDGRKGAFILMHNGTMNRGAEEMRITVVPDSGTGELTGISGTMTIIRDGGKHSYVFDYTIAASRP